MLTSKKFFKRVICISVALLTVFSFGMGVKGANTIETTFAATGSAAVSTTVIKDNAGNDFYKIYYPSTMTSNHPIIVWGNGTGALPSNYDGLLTHLASWGFVVIDTYCTTTGTGAEILAAAEYMTGLNSTQDSIFYQKLNVNKIGAAGHSQGSTGVINAHTNFTNGTIIKTVVSIALPALIWCDPEDKYDTSKIKVPFFIMGGTSDFIISPTSSNKTAYNNTAADLPSAMGMADSAGHNEIQGNGGKHRGYLTAWMRYQLMDDVNAKGAFAGSAAEIKGNTAWKSVAVKNITSQLDVPHF